MGKKTFHICSPDYDKPHPLTLSVSLSVSPSIKPPSINPTPQQPDPLIPSTIPIHQTQLTNPTRIKIEY